MPKKSKEEQKEELKELITYSIKKFNSVSSKKYTTKISKNTSLKKIINKKYTTKKISPIKNPIIEYYDLPYRYNETTVKILAQTPNILFIYWDISDKDRNLFSEQYGENFFNSTKPVLVITNNTLNYTFEVEINDFANSWYLHINDANCDYSVQLARRPIEHNSTIDDYVFITTSNNIQMPNNHILFDKLGKSVFFKNVKNNCIKEKNISSLSFMKNLGNVYNICHLFYDEININDLITDFTKLNLSSSNSSTFK